MWGGTEDEKKMKRYIHRHFKLPDNHGMEPDDAQHLLMEFGYHYVNSLLKYASDDVKPGMSVRVDEP